MNEEKAPIKPLMNEPLNIISTKKGHTLSNLLLKLMHMLMAGGHGTLVKAGVSESEMAVSNVGQRYSEMTNLETINRRREKVYQRTYKCSGSLQNDNCALKASRFIGQVNRLLSNFGFFSSDVLFTSIHGILHVFLRCSVMDLRVIQLDEGHCGMEKSCTKSTKTAIPNSHVAFACTPGMTAASVQP
ncbi:hypothetical protein CAPTEDRAFT_196921 [Capitella teleta]|uniref:Uncharacterized protein n=1 Tax=Capitella teleta TaxID=283909 RepID=R7UI43_CAPTE|nr:hypothetical protein CAPTEDRAFT_196921 [Capitella teleta]|eukprot:ELU06229.1 hypothetical protein CAPTEDRAFT_196921 [Capitella teleta]